jgi:uncharacterized protein YifN (PemK superfamily)
MPLTFHPGVGAIVICDFSTGFRPPEMVKLRPVVIISPRRRRALTVTVVPLSSSMPEIVEPWHYPIAPGVYPPARGSLWAKADMVTTVALDRLDRVMTRDSNRRRVYGIFQLSSHDVAGLHLAVKVALDIA